MLRPYDPRCDIELSTGPRGRSIKIHSPRKYGPHGWIMRKYGSSEQTRICYKDRVYAMSQMSFLKLKAHG